MTKKERGVMRRLVLAIERHEAAVKGKDAIKIHMAAFEMENAVWGAQRLVGTIDYAPLVQAVNALAIANYDLSYGWQCWVETQDNSTIEATLIAAGAETVEDAQEMATEMAALWTEKCDEAKAEVL